MEKNHFYVIVGLGLTGMSCARYLARKGVAFAVTDSREQPLQGDVFAKIFPGIEAAFGRLDEVLLDKADVIVLSPGVSLEEKAIARQKAKGKKIVGDIELFTQEVSAPIIAITGTNAKSTVTSLVGDMLVCAGYKVGVGGNLGIPVLDMLEQESQQAYVLEISSFQMESIESLKPAVACILNITPDHLDRHHSFEQYVAAKQRIYRHCKKAVCNLDDPATKTEDIDHSIYFGLQPSQANTFGLAVKDDQTYLAFGDRLLLNVNDLPMLGKHFQANALAALAIAYAFGLHFDPMLKALKSFVGLPHRCQFVREVAGVKWYNDSKGTNVGATLAAIDGLGQGVAEKLILIAGGVGKGADFSPLLPAIKKHVSHAVLLGEAAETLSKLIDGIVSTSRAESMEQAVAQAAKAAKMNDIVLLSPACASFDMFNNYEHRGQVFMDLVKQLEV